MPRLYKNYQLTIIFFFIFFIFKPLFSETCLNISQPLLAFDGKQEDGLISASNDQKTNNLTLKKFLPDNKKPISLASLIIGELVGLVVPGSGLAHFIVGDSRDGFTVLEISAASILTYVGAEAAVENGIIDDPNIYGTLHYGSILLFAGGYLFDLIGAPVYYFDYNSKISVLSKVEISKKTMLPDEIKFSLVNIGFSF